MNDRFRFRIPITNKDGKFEKFVYFDLFNQPAITCRSSDIFQNVEQCTGLKDKKGWLIYEGDIMKEKLFNIDIAVIKFGNGSGFQCFYPEWKGKYSKETKYNAGFRKDLYYWLKENKEGLEVIGNIHENPDLLEDK